MMSNKLLFFTYLLTYFLTYFTADLFCQVTNQNTWDYGEFELTQVSFLPSQNESQIPILQDKDGRIIRPPHWSKDGEDIRAAAYASGSPLRIAGVIQHDCKEKFWIRAKISTTTIQNPGSTVGFIPVFIPVEFTFGEKCFNGNPNEISTRAVYSATSSESFENLMVDFFNNSLPIEWQRAKDIDGKPGEFITFKTTDHLMYVTHKYPIRLDEVYETTIHIGCKYADGYSDQDIIVEKAWTPFDINVLSPTRVGDGAVFTYWNDCKSKRCKSLGDFLAMDVPDARCTEFVELFRAIGENQGFEGFNEITFRPPLTPSNMFQVDVVNEFGTNALSEIILFDNFARFAVKNWKTYISSASNNIFILDNIPMNCDPNWAKGDMGISGQGGVVDPLSLHVDHVALTYGSVLYDPSYGYKKIENRIVYEDDNLDTAYGLIFMYGNQYYYWIGELNNPGIPDTR